MNIKITGTWKRSKLSVAVSGAWRNVENAYVKVGGAWKPFYPTIVPVTYTVTVAQFSAPGLWAGFYTGGGGVVSPTTLDGVSIRDMNSSQSDIKGPMFFQFGYMGSTELTRRVRYVSVGIHEKLPYNSTINGGGVMRFFFGDGIVNVYEYLKALSGQNVTITLWVEVP